MSPGSILQALPPRRREDAIWLLSSLFACSKSEVLLDRSRVLNAAEARRWKGWWKRRLRGEPLQYITGFAPFYGREIGVRKGVLIPRPETEVLVELALRLVQDAPGARVLDIGTGTGCVALTLKAERPDLDVVGSDVSALALRVARANAERLGVSVRLEKHDLFSPSLREEKWDVVVSNPPYLEVGRDKIAPDVKKWEPRSALEPALSSRVGGTRDRAAWCAENILRACEQAPPRYTALELSPRVAASLEKKWKRSAAVERVWREADLAGRRRFLLVAWKERL